LNPYAAGVAAAAAADAAAENIDVVAAEFVGGRVLAAEGEDAHLPLFYPYGYNALTVPVSMLGCFLILNEKYA
jgi:hypothetical protein